MTSAITYRGLTWDHPRGYVALTEAAERTLTANGNRLLRWDRQALEGFESRPIGELARDYDLLVMDHPHIGEAVALDCLVPMEDVFPAGLIGAWEAQTVGLAMESYRWAGRHWALPLDVATQVMVSRPDLLAGPPPQTWDDVIRLSEIRPVALAIAGPHMVLQLFAICAALGHSPGGGDLLPDAAYAEAWRVLSSLYARAPAGTAELNPIALLEAMSRTDAIALVPLVYGYVNYAVAQGGRRALAFDDAPLASAGGRHGSVLGGTGIAITRRACVSPPLLDHLAWLLSDEAQRRFIPDHQGQPSSRTAWRDERVNESWAGFYRRTEATIAEAILRPRHDGYIGFQSRASALIRAALASESDAALVLRQLRTIWGDTLRDETGEAVQP